MFAHGKAEMNLRGWLPSEPSRAVGKQAAYNARPSEKGVGRFTQHVLRKNLASSEVRAAVHRYSGPETNEKGCRYPDSPRRRPNGITRNH